MEDAGFARLIYLSVLVAVILGSVLISRKGEFWKLARQAGVWLLIFVALVAAAAGWQDIRQTGPLSLVQIEEEGKIIIPKQRDGHFHLKLDVNGTPINFLVDTGASEIVLNQQDAQSLGFDADTLEYWAYANTANGKVRLAPVRLGSITLGGYKDKNVKATVNEGDMRTSLLGMSYLKRFSAIEIKHDKMILTR
jgi:aspartyl protease family protein